MSGGDEAVELLARVNAAEGNASHTTPRLQQELAFWLLDNPPRGPIVEIGTMHGGMTALFAYCAAVTERHCYAIDIDAPRLARTRATCASFDLDRYVNFFDGTLEGFVAHNRIGRADLAFLDSAHDYNTTLGELRALGSPDALPRALVLHDFNYRDRAQEDFFDDLAGKNPIAIDLAVRDFFSTYESPFMLKRCGTFAGAADFKSSAGTEPYGSEGMLIFFP